MGNLLAKLFIYVERGRGRRRGITSFYNISMQNESFSHSKNKSGKHTLLSKSFINLILRLTKETKDKLNSPQKWIRKARTIIMRTSQRKKDTDHKTGITVLKGIFIPFKQNQSRFCLDNPVTWHGNYYSGIWYSVLSMSCPIPSNSAFRYAIRTTNNLCGIFAQIRLQQDKLEKKRSHITVRRVKSLNCGNTQLWNYSQTTQDKVLNLSVPQFSHHL